MPPPATSTPGSCDTRLTISHASAARCADVRGAGPTIATLKVRRWSAVKPASDVQQAHAGSARAGRRPRARSGRGRPRPRWGRRAGAAPPDPCCRGDRPRAEPLRGVRAGRPARQAPRPEDSPVGPWLHRGGEASTPRSMRTGDESRDDRLRRSWAARRGSSARGARRGAARAGEEDAFGQELADEPAASAPERGADRDLALARLGPGEQEGWPRWRRR